MRVAVYFSLSIFFVSCQSKTDTLFTRLDPGQSGVLFENRIEESPEINILTYEYTYNGGGVAAADFNNDGLCDLYFSGNSVSNRLYLNRGNLKFTDITEKAAVEGRKLWKTGVTAVDVNSDGWMDLYVCYSGVDSTYNLSNQLFINNGCDIGGEPTFTEKAKEYGLDAAGTFSTQASFFDYDRDGDLDMFLINHGNHFYSPFINTNQLRNMRHPQFGNRLYRNDRLKGRSATGEIIHFTEVSSQAGIHGGGINFGLGISISDINSDGWPDIFVTNDYEEQDFLYINNQDGTFRDETKKSFGHLSRNGMGTDIADFNNDGNPDLIEVDMWPEDNLRQKLLRGPDDYSRYNLMLDSGFHHQQMRNTLQLNAGLDEEGRPVFCEVGQLAGISSTDWSWAPLFTDVDNDGLKDIFVTNGYLRDFTSMDFLKYTVEEEKIKAKRSGKELALYELIGKMPSTKTSDYLFLNNGNLTFTNYSKAAGIDAPNLSFGSAYADLDNDGDQELIINNTNETATIWLNHARELNQNNFLQIMLEGTAGNKNAIGTKVFLKETHERRQYQEQFPTRGFQSSVSPVLHFGLKDAAVIPEVIVEWPDGKISKLRDIKPNQRIAVSYSSALSAPSEVQQKANQFSDVTEKTGVRFTHHENIFHDYDHEPLLPYMLSRLGPAFAKGDVNKDGSEDFFVGGAAGQPGAIYLSNGSGRFSQSSQAALEHDAAMEDVGAVFFDADLDGDLDLFVVSGGNEFPAGSPSLDDRLYLNQGSGEFTRAPANGVIADHASGSCVAAADYDNDGDVDLFVGGRIFPGHFPITTPGALLRNDTDRKSHSVKFVVVTKEVNEELREPGMITDAKWADINSDGWSDLIIVGEWMSIRIFQNHSGKLVEKKSPELEGNKGLWKVVEPLDFDNDGDIDFVVGNAGTNLPWKVSHEKPMIVYYDDFNNDGRIDPVITAFNGDKSYPIASRDELLFQINSLRKKFTNYASYGKASIEQVLEPAQLQKAKTLSVTNLQSSLLENRGDGSFALIPLPIEAQISALQGVVSSDFTGDGKADLLIAGNFFPYRTQFGPSDASIGLLLVNDGKNNFSPRKSEETGFLAAGDVRKMFVLEGANSTLIGIARNDSTMSFYESRQMNEKFNKKMTVSK
jgi:enediyne biosynthesis protein E4